MLYFQLVSKLQTYYWTFLKDNRKSIDKGGHVVAFANLRGNSWRFCDQTKSLFWKFIFSADDQKYLLKN